MVITCKKPCKKKRSTMLTVEQMVDIALGTPEIGAVNFNVLHALIHVVVQQLNIQKYLVEFKGYDSDRMEGILMTAKPGPILKLTEYIIDSEGRCCLGKGLKHDETENEGIDSGDKKHICECMGKKTKLTDEEKEKFDETKKLKDEKERKELKKNDEKDEKENTKNQEKKVEKEMNEECEVVDALEIKRIRDTKRSEKFDKSDKSEKKSCPCKEGTNVEEKSKTVTSAYYSTENDESCQKIVRVEPMAERCDSWRCRPALAQESMIKLEEKVAILQDAFEALDQMATNEEIKKKARGSMNPVTPVKDLWQMYNLNKRVESCEVTMEKLASMVEDIVKETCNFREAMLVIADAVDDIECGESSARETCCAAMQGQSQAKNLNNLQMTSSEWKNLKDKGGKGNAENASVRCDGGPCPEEENQQSMKTAKTHNVRLTEVEKQPTETESQKTERSDSLPSSNLPPGKSEGEPQEDPLPPEIPPDAVPVNASQTIAMDKESTISGQLPILGIRPDFNKLPAAQKFCILKENVECLICHVKNLSKAAPIHDLTSKLCALASMQKQLDGLQKEWTGFQENLGGEEATMTITSNIGEVKSDVETLNNIVTKQAEEKQETDNTIKNILQEIENLKRVKADFELMEDLLAEKADAATVNSKVSHDQFDAACDDLTKGLDEALEKLMQQEAVWNEALEELHKTMENKLDKNEIMPLKDFISKKLKGLQEKLKQLAQLKKVAEAAGAKSRILRNLNCIACDNDVVMKMDNMASYNSPPMAATKSIKPMLTYELDQVRKAMKKGPPCRITNQAEDVVADAQKKAAGIPLTAREAVDRKISKLAHFCNRYCGGSHTITTPQQRVTRIGHFLTEFGPQALALFNQENLADAKPFQQGVPCPSEVVASEVDVRKPC